MTRRLHRPTRPAFHLALLALLLAACTQPPPQQQQGTLTLTLVSANVSALPGDEISVQLSVARGGGFAGEVAVSSADVPAGVIPPSPITIAAGSSDGSLALTLDESLAAGDTTLTVVAQGNGVLDTATLTIDVGEISGRIDTGFGVNGVFAYDRNSAQFYDLAVDGSGRIVAVGSWYSGVQVPLIVRLTADGALDTSFGSNGVIEVDTALGGEAQLRAVAIDGSGRIVATGDRQDVSDCYAVRVTSGGALDASFDGDGVVTVDSGASDDCYALAIDSSDRIVLAGRASNEALLARLNDDGTLDASFDGDGIATFDPGTGSDYFYGVVESAAGDLVAAGRFRNDGELDDFGLARVNPDGSLDAAFGAAGFVTTNIDISNDTIRGIALDGGRIVAAGYSGFGPGGNEDMALARYDADGSLDTGFGPGGTVAIDVFGLYDSAEDITVDADGSYVVAGYAYRSGYVEQFMVVAVIDADGNLDSSFNRDGKAALDELAFSAANAVAVAADGAILLAGYSSDGAVVVRLSR